MYNVPTYKYTKILVLKFRFSKKATKFETISHMIWRLLSKCQIKWEIVSSFLAFSEYPNFDTDASNTAVHNNCI